MREVEYRSSRLGVGVSFHEVELAIGQTGPLLSTSLGYDTSDILSYPPHYSQREVRFDVTSLDRAVWDEAVAIMESDSLSGSFGSLACDGWSTTAALVSADVDSVSQRYVSGTLTFSLVGGFWGRETTKEFRKVEPEQQDGPYLDYPFDFPHDYASPAGLSQIQVDGVSDLATRFVIYGPCDSPSLTIDGNLYSWDVSVPSGGYLVSDGTGQRKTITLISPGGVETDVFACGMRGAGKGSGSYCFETISPGVHDVLWDGSFGFDVVTQERRGGLPWTSS